MTLQLVSLLTFALAVALATASPGPTIAALLARVLSRGSAGMPAFCAGLVVGDMVWLGVAVFGLAVIAQAAQPVFAVVKYAGAAYLLWLAWRLWTAPATVAEATGALPPGEGWRLFAGGLALALGNPKTMIFYLSLAPALVDLSHLAWSEFAVLQATLVVVYGLVLLAYVHGAARARRLVRDSRTLRLVNRATGGVMAGAAVVVATR